MYGKLDIWPYLGKIFPVKLPNQVITMKLYLSSDQHFPADYCFTVKFSSGSFICTEYTESNSQEKVKAFELCIF